MTSKYFKIKTNSDEFKDNLNTIFNELKDKKVILFGAGEEYVNLDKKYDFKSKLNIVGIADSKFEKNTKKPFRGIKTVSPQNIPDEDFDVVLITNEQSKNTEKYLKQNLRLVCDIRALFVEEIKDEQINLNYLYEQKFDKTLPKLIKNMKGKKVIIYGAGSLFKLADKYFDLSDLDIIAITDQRYKTHEKDEKFLRWNVCSPEEVRNLKPDAVIIATKYYINMLHIVKESIFKDINVIPLVYKSFITLLNELWSKT